MDKRTPRVSLELMRGFRLAARHLSFTRAARDMFLTQSAVSREIRTLEQQIGQKLFYRVHGALKLTPAGEELYRVVDQTFRELDRTIERLSGEGRLLTVITTPALASLWLAPRLARFNQLRPAVEVRVVTSNDKPDLDADHIDVGIRFVAAGGDQPDLDPLMPCQSFPVCSPALADSPARPIVTVADLARHVRLDHESVRDGRRWSEWEFWFHAAKLQPVEPASTLCFPQFDQCFPAAIDGAGVAIGVTPHVNQLIRDGTLCAPLGPASVVSRGTFYLVLRRDALPDPVRDDFVAWLRAEAARDCDLRVPARGRQSGTC